MPSNHHKGYCSWCLKKVTAWVVERGTLSRHTYRCPNCRRRLVICRSCSNLAKWDTVRIGDKAESWHNQFCGEHRGEVPNFENLNAKLATPAQYKTIYSQRCTNWAKVSEITLYTVGGMAVVGPLALMAAPAIGGAIGTSMGLSGAAATNAGLASLGGGSLAAGGFGMAGGTAIVTALGSGVGGTLGAYVGAQYARDIEGFDICEVKKGKWPAIVTVNGFLTQNSKDLSGWRRVLPPHLVKKHGWYHVNWEAKRLSSLGKSIATTVAKRSVATVFKEAAKSASTSAMKKSIPLVAIPDIINIATNPWHVAMRKSSETGVLLADVLKRCKGKKFVVFGHSLGARVIYQALAVLATTDDSPIEEAHLFGGAVGNQRPDWVVAKKAVLGKIRNYMSSNDSVLKYMYSVGTFLSSDPIGRNRIKNVAGIQNIDTSRAVSGHLEYKTSVVRQIIQTDISD